MDSPLCGNDIIPVQAVIPARGGIHLSRSGPEKNPGTWFLRIPGGSDCKR